MDVVKPRIGVWFGIVAGSALATYAGLVARAWLRYGRESLCSPESRDPILDDFMPQYEVVERHSIRVSAPPARSFAAACEVDLTKSALVRMIFQAREMVLGAQPSRGVPSGLLRLTTALGWGVLAAIPMREVVMGAVTQPWAANPVFRALPPDTFSAFNEPGYVKIVWTLRAYADGPAHSIVQTETRAVTTSATARAQFRRYWAAFSPGIVLIRYAALRLAKSDAERIEALAA